MRRFVFVCVLLMAGVVTVSGSEGRGFSVEDLVRMDRISGPQASPDGEWVVFVKRHTDMDADRGRTDLWLVGTDGEGCANSRVTQRVTPVRFGARTLNLSTSSRPVRSRHRSGGSLCRWRSAASHRSAA